MKLMRETWIMAAVCLLDMVLTLWLIHAGYAKEANPVMQAALSMGIAWFIAVKCAYTFGPLTLLEIVGRRHTVIVRRYLRLGIGIYLTLHLASIAVTVLIVALRRWF
jgi:hypothetical protein